MRILEIEGLKRAARRRVPRMFFDYASTAPVSAIFTVTAGRLRKLALAIDL